MELAIISRNSILMTCFIWFLQHPWHFVCDDNTSHVGSPYHYSDVTMGAMASQITSLTIVYWTVYSGADEKKTSKLRVTCLCAGKSPGTGEFPAQMASNAKNVSIWWRHHAMPDMRSNQTRYPLRLSWSMFVRLSETILRNIVTHIHARN